MGLLIGVHVLDVNFMKYQAPLSGHIPKLLWSAPMRFLLDVLKVQNRREPHSEYKLWENPVILLIQAVLLLLFYLCYNITNCKFQQCHWNIIFYAGMLLSLRGHILTHLAGSEFVH